ncbi:DEAD/DEAH box helicase [Mucilaginibacter pedocola]|uniref:DEAD-box ATP-dependent RNA helicase RhpA n=1 Tax=Mucilaginibacter pedocola TaxID=1792845 RepID=A0A1S9PB28_9SPHI|nr:DEAD/DEAH box helicase [Mucilaginibacter pedocola]OOQ58172.1 DEAD/DEAH box helicase [Mucilaginibacter pedocola]
MLFQDLKLIEPILKALQTEGYTAPTPIQAQAIPYVLQQRDLLGCAQTGTGKTAAFAIPTLQLLFNDRQKHKEQKSIKALVLTPTRELAIQIGDSFTAYGKNTGLKNLVIFGGVSQNPQTDALKRGVDILIATPGRLLDLMNQRFIHLEHVKMLILDEADRMLDMGFVNDVKKIIAKVPQNRQTLFFSATMPAEIQSLADSILQNPAKVEVAPVSSTADTIQQSVYFVEKNDKKLLLNHILKDKTIKTALVFTRTKHGADKVVKDLTKAGITAEAIHGNKSQNARQRALTNFKNRTTRVLIATDIAARGIDIDELTHVINYEIPNIPETYVHRIGRTGRAGANGIAFTFCDGEEEIDYLKDIHKLIAKEIPVEQGHPYPLSPQMIAEKMQSKAKNAPAAKSQGGRGGSSRGGRSRGGNGGGNAPANNGGNRNGGGRPNGGNRGGSGKAGGNSGMSGGPSRRSGGRR